MVEPMPLSGFAIMLAASVIYLPGTGGSFLRRVLTLSDKSIMHHANEKLSATQKFLSYDNWTAHDWKQGEKQHRPAYRTGDQEFWRFESSPLYHIDAWHPAEFVDYDSHATVWQTGAWPWLIVITVTDQHRIFLEQNQATKTYSLDWLWEKDRLAVIVERYPERVISIPFESLRDRCDFLQHIRMIDQALDLDLDLDLVDRLWHSWYRASMLTWLH